MTSPPEVSARQWSRPAAMATMPDSAVLGTAVWPRVGWPQASTRPLVVSAIEWKLPPAMALTPD
jgi:hypothetical protein